MLLLPNEPFKSHASPRGAHSQQAAGRSAPAREQPRPSEADAWPWYKTPASPIEAELRKAVSEFLAQNSFKGPTAAGYYDFHMGRYAHTVQALRDRNPLPIGPQARVCLVGEMKMMPFVLNYVLGVEQIEVNNVYIDEVNGKRDPHVSFTSSKTGKQIEIDIKIMNAELDVWPYPNDYFDAVIFTEAQEHLLYDPQYVYAEANRVLKPGGGFLVTTPNSASMRSHVSITQGWSPFSFPHFVIHDCKLNGLAHPKEYSPKEMELLYESAGFSLHFYDTMSPYGNYVPPACAAAPDLVECAMKTYDPLYQTLLDLGYDRKWRGDTHLAIGKKVSGRRNRCQNSCMST